MDVLQKKLFSTFKHQVLQNDFEQATQLARAMVTEYGMSEKLGPVQYEGSHAMNPGQFTTDKSYSAHTAQLIDEEIPITFS